MIVIRMKNRNKYLLCFCCVAILLGAVVGTVGAADDDQMNPSVPIINPPGDGVNADYAAALRNADGRISSYEAALRTGDASKIRAAALELQKDPLAIRRVNASKGDAFKARLNQELNTIQSNTKALVKQRIAKQYGVPESEVTFFEATNPSDVVKVGQDWDVTVQVKGKDVPLDVSTEVVHESYYEAATGKKPATTRVAKDFAHQQAVEVTNYQHPEAYGGGGKRVVNGQTMTEGGEIIVGDKSRPLRDPNQMTQVMEHKSNMASNQARDIINKAEVKIKSEGLTGEAAENVRAGARADSQAWELEQARQYTKQFDRQTQTRVEAQGGKIPETVKGGTEILRQVADGEITPAEGRRLLKGMNETPESIIKKGTGLHEAAQTLGDSPQDVINRANAGQAPEDVFVENVKNRLEIKKLEKAAAEQRQAAAQRGGDADGPGPTNKTQATDADGPGTTKSSAVADADGPGVTGSAQGASAESALGGVRDTIKSAEVKMGQLAEADMARFNKVGSKVGAVVTAELPANAGALRQGVNTAGNAAAGALAVAGAAYEGGTIGYGVGSTLVNLKDAYNEDDPAMRDHLLDRAKNDAIETAEHVGTTAVMVGGAVASPVVVGGALTGYGAYQGTRAALENTETGKAIDKGVQDGMTTVLTTLDDATRAVTGQKSYDEINREDLSKRQAAWLRALERGDIKLQDGATVQDMLTYVRMQQDDGKVNSLQRLGDMSNVVQTVDKSKEAEQRFVDDERIAGDVNKRFVDDERVLGADGQTRFVDDERVASDSSTGDELADAMRANQPTPEERVQWQDQGFTGQDAETISLVKGFTGTSPDGRTEEEQTQQATTRLTSSSEDIKKKDMERENQRNKAQEKREDDQRQQQQGIDADKFTSDWTATIQGVNAALNTLNQQDAAKVSQMTQDAIKLIQQMQSGTLSDADFTSKLTQLQQQGAQLTSQGRQGWTSIIDQLINGQVNPGGGTVAGAGSGDAATAILSSVPPDQIDQRSIVCDTTSKSGNNTPASISVDMKGGTGVATLSYSLYSVKDRVLVQVNGGTVSDTGCTNGSSSIPIQVSGGDQVRVIVQPACEGSSTSWNLSVSCPKSSF